MRSNKSSSALHNPVKAASSPIMATTFSSIVETRELERLKLEYGSSNPKVAECLNTLALQRVHRHHGASGVSGALGTSCASAAPSVNTGALGTSCASYAPTSQSSEPSEQDLQASLTFHRQALKILEWNKSEATLFDRIQESRQYALEMAMTWNYIGDVLREKNEFKQSAAAFMESMDLFLEGLLVDDAFENGEGSDCICNGGILRMRLGEVRRLDQSAHLNSKKEEQEESASSGSGRKGEFGGTHQTHPSTSSTPLTYQEQEDQILRDIPTQTRHQIGKVLHRHPGYQSALMGISRLMTELHHVKFVAGSNAASSRRRRQMHQRAKKEANIQSALQSLDINHSILDFSEAMVLRNGPHAGDENKANESVREVEESRHASSASTPTTSSSLFSSSNTTNKDKRRRRKLKLTRNSSIDTEAAAAPSGNHSRSSSIASAGAPECFVNAVPESPSFDSSDASSFPSFPGLVSKMANFDSRSVISSRENENEMEHPLKNESWDVITSTNYNSVNPILSAINNRGIDNASTLSIFTPSHPKSIISSNDDYDKYVELSLEIPRVEEMLQCVVNRFPVLAEEEESDDEEYEEEEERLVITDLPLSSTPSLQVGGDSGSSYCFKKRSSSGSSSSSRRSSSGSHNEKNGTLLPHLMVDTSLEENRGNFGGTSMWRSTLIEDAPTTTLVGADHHREFPPSPLPEAKVNAFDSNSSPRSISRDLYPNVNNGLLTYTWNIDGI